MWSLQLVFTLRDSDEVHTGFSILSMEAASSPETFAQK
jgi:hypothetical protein